MNSTEKESALLTLAEAAKFLRLRVSTLRSWRLQRKHLAFVHLGRRVFIRKADVEALIHANLERPLEAAGVAKMPATQA